MLPLIAQLQERSEIMITHVENRVCNRAFEVREIFTLRDYIAHFNKTSVSNPFTRTVPGTGGDAKRKRGRKRSNRGRFMRNGDSIRPESPLICASGEPKESRRDVEREKCIRVSAIDKCTCIPSYCISFNYSPRFFITTEIKSAEKIHFVSVCVYLDIYEYIMIKLFYLIT